MELAILNGMRIGSILLLVHNAGLVELEPAPDGQVGLLVLPSLQEEGLPDFILLCLFQPRLHETVKTNHVLRDSYLADPGTLTHGARIVYVNKYGLHEFRWKI